MDSEPPAPFWKRPVPLLAIGALLVAGIVVFALFFAPKGTTTLSDDLESVSQGEAMQMGGGSWQGADSAHRASGTVQLLKDDGGHFLFFEDFDATSGPDVYLYAATNGAGDYRSGEVTRIPMAGGAEDGQATLRGDFRVDLPDGLDAATIGSLILWCDDFSVKFGHAVLA